MRTRPILDWRVLVLLPVVALTADRSALALEQQNELDYQLADKYATDVLLCRGPLKITYADQASTIMQHGWAMHKASGNWFPDHDRQYISGTWLSAHLEIPITTITGTAGFGQDLQRGECGWVAGKNPAAESIYLRGDWMEKGADPLRRYIEVDTAGNQTVRYTFPFSSTAKSPNALWLFKVPHQGSGDHDTSLLVQTRPTITYPKFNKP